MASLRTSDKKSLVHRSDKARTHLDKGDPVCVKVTVVAPKK
jgi:hypothetical protein